MRSGQREREWERASSHQRDPDVMASTLKQG